jgi:aryl-alcohol dehydrogenase-like predicted oxidoreductase
MKLALGTVQFGLNYGVANIDGQVTVERAKQILEYAKEAGIDVLDTAIGYGDSEQCLGNVGVEGWRVTTKLPALPEGCANVIDWVDGQFRDSLGRLGVNHIAGFMLHSPMQLLGPNGQGLWAVMQALKDKGLVEKIGFSIYKPAELDQLWENFQPDIVQAPYNIIDQRLKASGWLEKLHSHGVEVHVRSIFLQGLLLMKNEQRPEKFNRWKCLWEIWDEWLAEKQLSPIDVCLRFVTSEQMIDYVVVGVDTVCHLDEILSLASMDGKIDIPNELVITDESLLNPALW